MKQTTKKPAKAAPFWWFDSETVEALKERLGAAGSGTRLEVRVDAGKRMTLRVVPAGVTTEGASSDDLNKSHVCPPQCP